MKELLIEIAHARIKFSTNFTQYFDYVQSYFAQTTIPTAEQLDIEIVLDWSSNSINEYIEHSQKLASLTKIGGSTYTDEKRVMSVQKIQRRWKTLFDARVEDGTFKLHAVLAKNAWKDFFRFGPMSKPQDEWYFMMTNYLVYYPLFWFMESVHQTHMLHASALEVDKKGIVICGMEGIGKTSLALKFLNQKDAVFLSDNLVFYNHEQLFGCYELIRLHDTDAALWGDHFEKVNTFNFLKGFYKPKAAPSKKSIKPDILIFPEFSGQFFIERLDNREAVHRALALSYLPAELGEYLPYRSLFNLLDIQSNPSVAQYNALSQLFSQTKCYRIGMPKSEGLERNFEKLRREIEK